MKNEAGEKIQKIIEHYQKLSVKEVQSYNEEQTKTHFIQPLFETLGWDFTRDVWPETDVSGQRVDYAFKLNGITKMYIEAKSLKTDLDLEQHAKQAINYAWNHGVAWAVLTDFEGIKVFNAQADTRSLQEKLVFEISYNEYVIDERLELLSKENFAKNALDDYAIKYGKKLKKLTVNEKLFSDLKVARELLTAGFKIWNKDLAQETIEEGVQRILDRLVFIRVLEDRKLEDPVLWPLLREWQKNKNEQFFQKLIVKFRELDVIYNSNLFSPHACEAWEEYEIKWDKVLGLLYGSHVYEYDFSKIPADILGGVYESYLSYIAQNSIDVSKKWQKGELFEVESKKESKAKSRQKRKEQGIFYTPKFIVDYIVEHTLGEKLKEVRGVNELKQLRILDPACGSGSFLTKALKVMNDKYKDFNYPGDQYTKSEILLSNIYGVDLDAQAVELAKLNLLIEALDTKAKLPNLTGHVRVGNSLISGSEDELKKYFGDSYRDKRPFNWPEEFPEVFNNGGFDVIIGNPPYVSFYSKQAQTSPQTKEELNFFRSNYAFIKDKNKLGRFNMIMFFIERTIILLNEGGIAGVVVDMNIFGNPYRELRKYLLENTKILNIVVNLSDFDNVASGQVIIVFQKNKNEAVNNANIITWIDDINNQTPINIKQSLWNDERNDYNFIQKKDDNIEKLIQKIESSGIIGDVFPRKLVRTSVTFTGKKDNFLVKPEEKKLYNEKLIYPLLEGSSGVPYRYALPAFKNYINYDEKLRDKLNAEYIVLAKQENKRTPMVIGLGSLDAFKSPKILVRLSSQRITATYSADVLCADLSLYVIVQKDQKDESIYDLRYALAILNSKLVDFYAKEKKLLKQEKGGMPQIRLNDLKKIPLYNIDFSIAQEKFFYNELIKLSQQMLELNKKLQDVSENSDKWSDIKREIEKTDKEIDGKVFELYGLGEEERKIVESNDVL